MPQNTRYHSKTSLIDGSFRVPNVVYHAMTEQKDKLGTSYVGLTVDVLGLFEKIGPMSFMRINHCNCEAVTIHIGDSIFIYDRDSFNLLDCMTVNEFMRQFVTSMAV